MGLNATITQEPQVIENIKLLVEPYKSNPFWNHMAWNFISMESFQYPEPEELESIDMNSSRLWVASAVEIHG